MTIFGLVGDNVTKARSTMEMTDQLRATKQRLQLDLAGVTVQMLPPRNPDNGEGYFEVIEGPVGRLPPNTAPVPDPNNSDTLGPDTTVGDTDDILMLTDARLGRSVHRAIFSVPAIVCDAEHYGQLGRIQPDCNPVASG